MVFMRFTKVSQAFSLPLLAHPRSHMLFRLSFWPSGWSFEWFQPAHPHPQSCSPQPASSRQSLCCSYPFQFTGTRCNFRERAQQEQGIKPKIKPSRRFLLAYCVLKLNLQCRQVSKDEDYDGFSILRLCLSSGGGEKI